MGLTGRCDIHFGIVSGEHFEYSSAKPSGIGLGNLGPPLAIPHPAGPGRRIDPRCLQSTENTGFDLLAFIADLTGRKMRMLINLKV